MKLVAKHANQMMNYIITKGIQIGVNITFIFVKVVTTGKELKNDR